MSANVRRVQGQKGSRVMAQPPPRQARSLAELIGGTLDPLVAKRGFAKADILAFWPEIVGAAYAGRTSPERIRWPRAGEGREAAATLTIRCDPSVALALQHDLEGVRERLNAFLGFPAIGAVRIRQHPVGQDEPRPAPEPAPDPEALRALEERLSRLDAPLGEALLRLGRQILARS
jgi:hypothetical protein